MDSFHESLLRYVYLPLAAVAGAITSLASSNIEKMTRTSIALNFIVGFSFAIFVTPWIASSWFDIEFSNIRALCGLTYIFGAGSNILLPVFIDWMKRSVGSGGKDASQ